MPQLTREQLYSAVWEQPMQRLASTFGLSAGALVKLCRKADIPLPARGHWVKLQSGKPVERPPLPPRPFGLRNEIEVGSRSVTRKRAGAELPLEAPRAPTYDETMESVRRRAESTVKSVHVPQPSKHIHPSIARYLHRDEVRRAKQRQFAESRPWYAPLFDSPLERRRLQILSALFTVLQRCGASPRIRGHDARVTSALVGNIEVPFSLDRKNSEGRKVEDESLRFELYPWASVEPSQCWEDTRTNRMEDQLGEIAAYLLFSGEFMLRDRELQRHSDAVADYERLLEKARLRQESARRQEYERLMRETQDRIDTLISQVSDWRRAADIRAFIYARLRKQWKTANPNQQTALKEWADWANEIASRIDPLSD